MSLIEGVGDDVVLFVAVVFIIVLLILAWFSTHVTDRFLINVIVLDRSTFQALLRRLHMTRQATPPPPTSRSSATTAVDSGRQGTRPEGGGGGGSGTTESRDSEVNTANAETISANSETATVTSSSSSEIPRETGDVTDTQPKSDPAESSPSESVQTSHSQNLAPQESADLPPAATDADPIILPNTEDVNSTNSTPDIGSGLRHRFSSGTTKSSQATFTAVPDSETVSEVPPSESNISSATETIDTPPAGSEEAAVDNISVKIKYLDDREREVQARSGETIGEFKRRHFASELADNFSVRFVYNGQELRQDSKTLQSYNVRQNSVIHCLLTRAQTAVAPANQAPGAQELDLSVLMFPLFGLILALIWYCRFCYKNYFNALSTFSLIGITFLFVVGVMAAWRPRILQDRDHD